MQVSDIKKWVKVLVEKEVPVVPMLVGSMGIGKSEIVKQIAAELKIGLIDLRLAQMEPGDLIGIPYREGIKTQWAKPGWWPEPNTKGILFLDELNRAPVDVRQAIFQLVWDKKLHTHVLPSSWNIVVAVNPEGENYQTEQLDKAFNRRVCLVAVEPNVDVWLSYAMKEGGVSTDITGFIGTHKDMLFEEESFDLPAKRNPAGWSTINLLRKANAIPMELEFEIIAGIVGKEAAAAFRKYLDANYERPVAGEAVLQDYDKVKAKVLKQRTKADEMYVTIREVINVVEQTKKPSKKQLENLTVFMLDLTADFQTMLAQKLPAEIISILGEDERWSDTIGRSLKEAKGER